MKRRNADCGKIRRPIKRNKIAEQIGSNTLLYVKFLLLWAFVITADFLLEFRFEFLWPFWLLLRSVYDSFKYKGLAFSVLFVCIAITSDLVCLFFIPVQWLFFAASTYVWVQYVWHTDKGICLPTIILWILFVYLEAAIRWKDSRNIPHLDLCRPFAAHCIGYPVVTLGFGFKSYVGYRIRQRKQREVAKDNDFYMQLLQEALPKDESTVNGETNSSVDQQQQQQDHQLSPSAQQKELSVTAAAVQLQTSSTNSTSSNSSNSSGGGGGGGQHHHHHSSKNAQSHNKSQSNVTSTSHANGHAGGGTTGSSTAATSISAANSTMNGGVNHSKPLHRKSLDKDGSGTPSGKANSYSYHQQQQQQQSSTGSSNSAKESSRSNDSSHTNGAAMSPKEKKDCDSTGQKSHFDSLSSASYHQTHNGGGSTNKSTQANESNHDSGGGSRSKGQQNGHVVNCDMELHSQQQVQQHNHIENDPPAEPKANRSGRKNRVKQKENANHLAAVRLAATLALASSITTLTTTAAAAASTVSTSTATATTTTTSTATSMTSKDNHLHHHHHHQNHDQQQQQQENHSATSSSGSSTVSNNTQSGGNSSITGSTVISSNAAPAVPSQSQTQPVPPPVVPKVCDTCSRLEADAKKLRAEITHMKQGEYEMRQKYDSNTGNLKNCLQAKQKDYDDLQNKFQDLTTQRQQERQNMQTVERRLGEERRIRQSLESQLQNERKHRKQAEEKAARAECGESCKLKRQQLDMEIQKLRRELINSEDAKHNAETQNRNFEQEMRNIEVQLRNRESQQSSEVLMSALAAMQDKNATLEKNLSAETRVKLDLFSALGDARRQLEIATCSVRTKEKEILDLKAKIVQLLAVMPGVTGEPLCLSVPGGPSSSGGGGLRLADAPQLLSQSALNGQPSPMSHIVMNSPPLISQLSQLGVLTSTITTPTAAMTGVVGATTNVVTGGAGMIPHSVHQQQQQQQQQAAAGVVTVAAAMAAGSNGQIVQMQNSNNCPSSLDPNASVYMPKNCSSSMVGGTEA